MGLLQNLLHHDSSLTPEKLLLLEINVEYADMEHPIIWYVAATLFHIWECRVSTKRAKMFTVMSEIESRIALLRETRYRDSAAQILEIMNADK